MSPILKGVIASGISGHLTPPWSPEGGYDSLAAITVGSTSIASIEFSGIPTAYKHLQLRTTFNNTSLGDFYVNLNTNYGLKGHYLYGNGTTYGAGVFNPSSTKGIAIGTGQYSTSIPVACIIDILDANNTNKYKTLRSLGGQDTNAGGTGQTLWFSSAVFDTTEAVTSIIIKADYNFSQYTQWALYGIK